MSTDKVNSGSSESTSQSKVVDWMSAVPKGVDYEDALGIEDNKRVWQRIYQYAGMVTASEGEKRSLRAAVYVYCAKNGTSREGEYAGEMALSNGKIVSASVIPRAATKMKIRKFLRANMIESYDFFKVTKIMESDERFISRCSQLGISPESAFAVADWMADCPMFTPAESKAHTIAFVRGIDRARRARDGKALETVEAGRIDDVMNVQGPGLDHHGVSVDF